MTRIWLNIRGLLALCTAIFIGAASANAQQNSPHIALKGGESAELMNLFFIINCRSVMIGSPEVEILEGPAEVSLSVKEEPILPRAQNCANTVPGGKLLVAAKDVDEPKEGKLTFRVKYKAKSGDRQFSYTYIVSLFP